MLFRLKKKHWGKCADESLIQFVYCRKFAIKNFLPVAFAVAFIIALSWPWLGQQVVSPKVIIYASLDYCFVKSLATSASFFKMK